jgi:hypothetical protein
MPSGMSSDNNNDEVLLRLRTMEQLLALIGDPLGGQGLGVAETLQGQKKGLEKDVEIGREEEEDGSVGVNDDITTKSTITTTTTAVTVTGTIPDTIPTSTTTSASWLPKVPGFNT